MTTEAPVRAEGEDGRDAERTRSSADAAAPATADATLAAIGAEATAVKRRELDECIRTLEAQGDLAPDDRAAVESMADAIVARLLAVPARSLQDADEETLDTACELFGQAQSAGGASR